MSPESKHKPFFAPGWRLAAKRPCLLIRSTILQAIRTFFLDRGYLEVETPILIPAPAPELHIDAVPAGNLFLHTSPELCMKRLLASGFEKIFQVCRCFREGERGNTHLPEFTLLEWYRAKADYLDLMGECEEMLLHISAALGLGEKLSYQRREIDLRRPWDRIKVRDALQRFGGVSMEQAMLSGSFDEIMVTRVEPNLGFPKPTFLSDYPSSLAALARTKRGEPQSAERFELYIAGLELANAFSELTDAEEQRRRFEREREERMHLGKRLYPLPEKFLEALPFMPESAGIALGVDRLVMIFSDQNTIDPVVTFTPEEL